MKKNKTTTDFNHGTCKEIMKLVRKNLYHMRVSIIEKGYKRIICDKSWK